MSRHGSTWIAARARNAARQGGWIAGIGGVAVIATLLALVMVPRELDRQVHLRIASLPVVADSMPVVRRIDSLRVQLPLVDSVITPAPVVEHTAPDSLSVDLMARITRARTSPLPDSYRELADAPMLRDEPRVRALLDSIDLVDREREAHAALGGPGAQYAGLTARMTALGQALVRLAEQRVATRVFSSITAGATAPPDDVPAVTPDRALALVRDTVHARLARDESLLVSLRERHVELDAERASLEKGLNVALPPFAMLIAALIVGVAFGYSVVLARELRRPTVGDVIEVERLTGAPVLMHVRSAHASPSIERRSRERPGTAPIIDRDSDTFVLLHLALSGVGDVVNDADVLADDPIIGAAVALGISAAATRESRAALVVEWTRQRPLLAHLLRITPKYTLDDVRGGVVGAEEAVHVVKLDRDAHIDVLLAGVSAARRPRVRAEVPAIAGARRDTGEYRSESVSAVAELQRAEHRYDIRLHLVDPTSTEWPAARDIILCARQGSTPLAWLANAMQRAKANEQRVRAVVVWGRAVIAETSRTSA